jgi:3-isopropylmalate/(R)-2-methylmalate dehydratase small subunit
VEVSIAGTLSAIFAALFASSAAVLSDLGGLRFPPLKRILMKPFTVHRGRVAPLERLNVDTDQIIPKQFLKRIEKTGFGQFLFYDWRFGADGKKHGDFVLDEPRYAGASILVAGKNFGCGSSREHAVWALSDFGFRAVISSSFADIFANNSTKNGFLAVRLNESDITELMTRAREIEAYELTIDLEQCEVRDDGGFRATFSMDEFVRHCLLNGLDDIGLTLQHEAEIAAYEARHPAARNYEDVGSKPLTQRAQGSTG